MEQEPHPYPDFNVYLVFNPDHGPPRVVHSTEREAVNEAKRLAADHPGQRFYVMSAVGCAMRQEPVEWFPNPETPF